MNNNAGQQQQRPQAAQFGGGPPQQSPQMTNITGMQMPSGQIRYQINNQQQPGMVHVVQNVGMPVGNVQMAQQQQNSQSQPQQQQYQQVILSNQLRPAQNQPQTAQQQQTVNVAFSPHQFQQSSGPQFYIQQQPNQLQPGQQRIFQLQTAPNGPQQVFVGQQNIRPQTFNFPAQNIQQRQMAPGTQPTTRLVTINPQQPGGSSTGGRPMYQPMPPQGFIPSGQQQHSQAKVNDTPTRFPAVLTASHSSASSSFPQAPGASSQPTWMEESKEVLSAARMLTYWIPTSVGTRFHRFTSDCLQVLTKKRLEDLVKEVDQFEVLDEDVKDALLQLSDDFIESLVRDACQIAKHRKSRTLDVKDVQLCLERNWNMWIPGFGSDDLKPYKKAPVTDAHKQRMALIRKNLKKGT